MGVLLLFLPVVLTGCAAGLSSGERLYRDGDYRAAADAFRVEESEDLYDPGLKRLLAASWLGAGEPERARVKLREALALAPEDPLTWFLLGDAHAALDRSEDAILAYQQYLNLGGPERGEIRARIHRLSRERIAREIRTAIEDPEGVTTDSTLAVAPFLNVAEEEALAPLSQGLAAVLITDLRKVRGFRVLEREHLGVLLRELALSGQDPTASATAPSTAPAGEAGAGAAAEVGGAAEAGEGADPSDPGEAGARREGGDPGDPGDPGSADGPSTQDTAAAAGESMPPVDARNAPLWGRLLGAERFVQGFFTRLGDDRLLIGADVVSTAGVAVAAGAPLEGPLSDVLYLEKGLVRRVLATLGIEPTEDEERELDELLTGSPEAFFAYARGLRLLDQGRGAEAREAFLDAVAADPSFTEAADAAELAAADEDSFDGLRAGIWERLAPEKIEPVIDDGLIDIAVRVGGGPAPDGSDPGRDHESGSVLGPSAPDRIDVVRRIPTLPPPPHAGGDR